MVYSKKLLCFLLCALPLCYTHPFGLGVQRIRKFRGHRHINFEKDIESASDDGWNNVQEHYFSGAVVDNYVPFQQQKNWPSPGQRYYVNDQFWGGNGYPIFLYIGGEGPETGRSLTDRLYMYSLAQEHQALMVDLEHRYYGKSYPTENMNNTNIQYLSSFQALADLARFVENFTEYMSASDSELIAFGGSYPGNLAAWFRLKYPHLVKGSVASSAPVQAEVDFLQYMEVVGQALVYFGGQTCYDNVLNATTKIAELIELGEFEQLRTDFNTCTLLTNDAQNLSVFQSNLMGNFQGTVQYNLEIPGVMTVSDVCEKMSSTSDVYQNFVELSRMYLVENGESCIDISWEDSIAELSITQFDGESSYRQWFYQTCNEFGYYQTTTSENQPFYPFKYVTLQSYLDMCSEVFGVTRQPESTWTNNYYGATGIYGSNIAFPTGTIDPWHAIGVTNSTDLPDDSEVSVFIVGTAHCADMYSPKPTDPETLTAARSVIAEQVNSWLTNE